MQSRCPGNFVTRRAAIITGLAISNFAANSAPAQISTLLPKDTHLDTNAGTTALRDAWQVYNSAVERARLAMESTPRFTGRRDHRAAAYASLAEAQSMAYTFAIAPRMDHPVINTRAWYHNVHTLGGTSANLYHVSANVDGSHRYRLSGRLGDVKVLVMQVFNTNLGGPGQKQVINVDLTKMADADGKFEAILSAKPETGNWIPLDGGSDLNFLFIRRFYDEWYGDRGALDIELLDGPINNNDFDEFTVARRILRSAEILMYLVEQWNIGIYNLYLSSNSGIKNSLALVPGNDIASTSAGSPSTIYTFGVFAIEEDEALIIEIDEPDALFWSLQIQDAWTRPINYLDHQSDINGKQAVIDRDGKFRAVICVEDPGVANWLDPDGRLEGTIVGRAYHPQGSPRDPTIRRVKVNELKRQLPDDTTYVTPAQRREAMKFRRNGLLKMFGDT